jgi:hypothetical protein
MIKTLPIKGLIGEEMALDDFLKHMHQEALSKAEAFPGEHSLEPTSAPSLVIRGTSPLKRANQALPLLCDCTHGEGPLCLDPRQAKPMVLPNQVSHHEALRFACSLVSLLPSLARKTSTVSMSLPRPGHDDGKPYNVGHPYTSAIIGISTPSTSKTIAQSRANT